MSSTLLKSRTRQIGNFKGRTTINSKSEKHNILNDSLTIHQQNKKKSR
jgi:hypothetical protein